LEWPSDEDEMDGACWERLEVRTVLIGKPEGKKQLGRLRPKWISKEM
jgi:hypothetical protein